MKQGLSLRVSQHLALTPQLQQSIRLLQLSTLELGQEIQQMLDDNPFLEVQVEEAGEEFGLAAADPRATPDEAEAGEEAGGAGAAEPAAAVDAETEAGDFAEAGDPSWEGDGSTETVPDDGEWGGEAPAARRNAGEDDEVDATELARSTESLQAWLHRQALALRLSPEDALALRYLIGSINDDGYLEESLDDLAAGLAPDDLEQREELLHRFTVALRLLQSLDPAGVGARSLAECLLLQLRVLQQEQPADEASQVAMRVCAQPIELLPPRHPALAQLCAAGAAVRCAIALIIRLEPKPAPLRQVEPNIVVPDVTFTPTARARRGLACSSIPSGAAAARARRLRRVLQAHRGEPQALQHGCRRRGWFIKNIQQRFDTILRVSPSAILEPSATSSSTASSPAAAVLRESPTISASTSRHLARDHRQVHGHAVGTSSRKTFVRPGHRDGRQRLQHRGARADQQLVAAENARSRCRTARSPRCSRSRHRVRPSHRRQVPRSRESPPPTRKEL